MPFIAWNDRLSVHIQALDQDHQRLVAILNELYDAIGAGQSQSKISEGSSQSHSTECGFPSKKAAQHQSQQDTESLVLL